MERASKPFHSVIPQSRPNKPSLRDQCDQTVTRYDFHRSREVNIEIVRSRYAASAAGVW